MWSGRILNNLNDEYVYVKCANTDYEGEIKGVGDTVKIFTVGRPTVGTYTKNNWTSITPEVVDMADQILRITESKYFAMGFDDVDDALTKGDVFSKAIKEGSDALAETADTFMATTIAAGVPTGTANTLTARTIGGNNDDAYETLVDLGVLLDQTNTPKGSRWAVVPPWFIGELLKDPRFVSFGTGENLSRAMQGMIKTMSGFDLRVSNNTPTSGSASTILAGYNGAVAFAEAIPAGQPEAYRIEQGFGDAVKALHLYGAKVLRPSNLAAVAVTKE